MTKNDTVLFNSHLTLSGYDNAHSLTIIQSDDTVLEFTLRDKNLEPITLIEKVGQAQIIDSKRNALVATFDVQIDGSKATFSIDKILPVADYELYIKIGNQYFPSKEQSFILRVIKAYDVVDDIDLSSRTTIDIVVDALRDDVISVIKEQLETQIDAAIKADPSRFKGEKGDKFTRDDFTEEEWLSLKGEKGDKGDTGDSAYEEALKNGFVGSEVEWLESLKGKNGLHGNTTSIENNEDGSYDIVVANPTTEVEVARITIRDGADGINGSDGKNLRYEDLTPEQIAELKENLAVRPPQVYTRLEYDALSTYDPHTLYIVTDEVI